MKLLFPECITYIKVGASLLVYLGGSTPLGEMEGDTLSELVQKQKAIPYLPLLGSPVEYKADGALSVAITLTL